MIPHQLPNVRTAQCFDKVLKVMLLDLVDAFMKLHTQLSAGKQRQIFAHMTCATVSSVRPGLYHC